MKLTIYTKFNLIPNNKKIINSIPIFATPEYANYLKKTKNSIVIWFNGKNDEGIDYLIPLNLMKKGPFKKGTFLTAVVSLGEIDSLELEKEFLNKAMNYIKSNRLCHWIQQSPNSAIFRTYPDDAVYVPFGTYRINLQDNTEEELFQKLYHKVRQRINKVIREKTVMLKKSEECYDDSIDLIRKTAEAANLASFTKNKFDLINNYLKDSFVDYVTYVNNEPQSSILYFYNSYSVYGMFAGSKRRSAQGATELLVWEAIKESKKKKIKYFDFVGARIDPDKDSKQYRIQRNKMHMGGELYQGFMWKLIISKRNYFIYIQYNRLLNKIKGKKFKMDIIEQELNRLKKN